jgi:putative phage-type endonuclease
MSRAPYSGSSWFWPRRESTWHRLRSGDVTATAAAALYGASPYMTPFDLFHRLAGNVEVVFGENERMLWGKRLQNAIALGICQDNGWRIVDRHPFLYARSARFAHMGASPDFVIADDARPAIGLGLLEIKNVDTFIAKDEWTADESPVHIEFQLQHQLEACDLGWGVVGGLIGGNDTRVYRRDRDRDVGDDIGSRINELFARIERNDPPAPDYLADYETIRTLYRNAAIGKELDLEAVEPDEAQRLLALIEADHAAGLRFKESEEDKKRARAELIESIGDNERVISAGWKVSARTTHRSEAIVTQRATSFRNVRVTKIKPKEAKA